MKTLLIAFACLASSSAFAEISLRDLEATTFSCPAAALNIAAREASRLKTAGMYQFSSYKIISDSSLAKYEVGFTSNVSGEKAVTYEVSVYCQQGIDPNTTAKIVIRK